MRIIYGLAAAAALAGTAAAQDVSVGGENPLVCTVSNNGSATVALDSSDFAALDGGARVGVTLGEFDVYCNAPNTLTMSSQNGALENFIDLSGVTDNGNRLIPYVMRVSSVGGVYDQESFVVPGAHAAGLTGGQGFRKTKNALNGITDTVVTYTMEINNDSRPNEQRAAAVQDSSLLYAGTYTETATLTITPTI